MKTTSRPLIVQIARIVFCVIAVTILVTCNKNKKSDETYDNSFVPANPPGYGLVRPSDAAFDNIPRAPTPVGAAGSLPGSFSLEIPITPFYQGQQGSCASCASAMTKSIMDHLAFKTPYVNNGIIYSPSYLYFQTSLNPGVCDAGSDIIANLEVMRTKGICSIADLPYSELACAGTPTPNQDQLAALHKIFRYYVLPFDRTMIKQYINQGQPVIVCLLPDDNFAVGYWNPAKKLTPWTKFGTSQGKNHATLLYGWDDTKNAFRMLNQWGDRWGDNGSIWVDYGMVENKNVCYVLIALQNSTSNANGGTVDLTGDLTFGSINVNSSLTKQLKVTNNTGSAISVSSLTVNQPFTVDWSGGAIASAASQLVNVTFKPTSAGSFNQTISVNYAGSQATATATGTGLQVSAPTKIILLSGDLNFGNVNVGQSANLSFNISNQGNTPLNVSSISLPSGFTGNYTGQVAANGTAGIFIYFTPGTSGLFQGKLVVNSDAASGINSVNVTGSGTTGSSGPSGVPSIGTYADCVTPASNSSCSNFGDGVIRARVISVNNSTKQIVFEIKKCDGSTFGTDGYINVVSSLCGSGPVIYGTQQFTKGGTTAQITCTDPSMTGSKTYYVYTFQTTGTNQYFYDAPPLLIRY